MRRVFWAKALIPMTIVALILSACMTGCGSKGKKEQATSTAATPAEEISVPEPPGEPVIENSSNPQAEQAISGQPAQQNQAAQQGPGQQTPDETIIINNNPPAVDPNAGAIAGDAAGTGAGSWWNPWGGFPPQGNQPGNPQPGGPVQGSGGIIVYSVGFIPEGAAGYATETTVGQRGTLSGSFANKYDTDKQLHCTISANGVPAKDQTNWYPAETMQKFECAYTFDAEGTYPLWFGVEDLAAQNFTQIEASNTIKVWPVGGGGGNQGGDNHWEDLVIAGFGYVPSNTDELNDFATVNDPGKIRVVITNRSGTQSFPVAYAVVNHSMAQLKKQDVPLGPNATANVDIPRTFTTAGEYAILVELYPDGTQASRKTLSGVIYINPLPVLPPPKGPPVIHDVDGHIDLINSRGVATTEVTDHDTCFAQWTVGNRSRDAVNGVRVNIMVDGVTKDSKTLNLSPNPAGKGGIVYNIKFPADNKLHHVTLAIDSDKRITRDITVNKLDLATNINLKKPDGSPVREANDQDIYSVMYSIVNNCRTPAENVHYKVLVDRDLKEENTVGMGPNPGNKTGRVDNVMFDRPGHHVLTLHVDPDINEVEEINVVHKDAAIIVKRCKIEVIDEEGNATDIVNTTDKYRLKITFYGDAKPRTQTFYSRLWVDDKTIQAGNAIIGANRSEQEYRFSNIGFSPVGPRTIVVEVNEPDHVSDIRQFTKVVVATVKPDLATTRHAQTAAPVITPVSKPKIVVISGLDAKVVDIGFIPEGARDYYDVVTAGKRGKIYAAYENASSQEIRDLKMQVLVDGAVVRESIKRSIGPGQRATISIAPYWFNAGRHKMSLILDPDNAIQELSEKNNRIGRYIDAVPRQQPQQPNYNNAAVSRLFDNLGNLGDKGGSGTTPPSVYTPPVMTGTPDPAPPKPKVPTPVVKVKGLGQ